MATANNLLDVTAENVYSRICWSADGMSPEEIRAVLYKMKAAGVDLTQLFIKIDRAIVEEYGYEIIEQLQEEFGIRVFFDGKYIEVGSKLAKLGELAVRGRPYMVNCMAGGVSTQLWDVDDYSDKDKVNKLDGLKRFALACEAAGVRACGVTVLTTKEPDTVADEFGREAKSQVLWYVRMLNEAGFTDIVCSPEEAAFIREHPEFDHMCIWTPGVRPVGSSVDDQARVDTPEGTLASGADVAVIGRPISVGDPVANIINIADNLVAAAKAARGEAA